jgi:hypothetical protein
MSKLLYTLKLDPQDASPQGVTKLLNLDVGDLDEDFGVVSIDPDKSLYSILVDERAVPGANEAGGDVKGPFANPRIEPFNIQD